MSGVRGGHWLGRTVRGMRPDRNPLRRGTDRIETCLLAGLLAAAAAAAPLAAHAASGAAYSAALQARQQQLAGRYQVEAVLVRNVGPISGSSAAAGTIAAGVALTVPAQASWTSVRGARRSGAVPAQAGSRSGTAVPVWTDQNGYLVSPPLTMAGVAGAGDAAASGAVTGITVAWAAATAATRLLLGRRRIAAWEADWSVTAPEWNRQRW